MIFANLWVLCPAVHCYVCANCLSGISYSTLRIDLNMVLLRMSRATQAVSFYSAYVPYSSFCRLGLSTLRSVNAIEQKAMVHGEVLPLGYSDSVLCFLLKTQLQQSGSSVLFPSRTSTPSIRTEPTQPRTEPTALYVYSGLYTARCSSNMPGKQAEHALSQIAHQSLSPERMMSYQRTCIVQVRQVSVLAYILVQVAVFTKVRYHGWYQDNRGARDKLFVLHEEAKSRSDMQDQQLQFQNLRRPRSL